MAAGDCGEAEAEAEGRLVKKDTGEERSEDGEAVREFQFRHSLPTSSFTVPFSAILGVVLQLVY